MPLRRLYLLLIVGLSLPAFSQHLTSEPHVGVETLPVQEDVYAFLRHLSVRGVITGFSESVLPISEFEVVEFLEQAHPEDLSESERDLRGKYLRTFERIPYEAVTLFPADSSTPLLFGGITSDLDKYLYRWRDTETHSDLQVNGIGSLEYRTRTEPVSGKLALGLIGGRIRGTLSGHVGYFLEATNGSILGGDSTIALEDPVIGKNKNFAVFSNHIFFDNTTAEFSYNYDWFTARLARNALSIGGSYSGDNIFISPSIPTIDYLSLGAHVGAVRYTAIVGSLLGDARFSAHLDSSLFSYGPGAYIDPKYLALHRLSIALGAVEFGFTDLTIFSRRFDLAYVNPFSFLKSVEQSLNDRDNGLLGADIRWQVAKGIELRGSGLMDDVIFSRIGTGWWGNKFAWQLGALWAAPLGIHELDVAAEYTHVEPFTYSHYNSQNAFTTSGEIIGSSIGPNSKRYWGQIRFTPTQKFSVDLAVSLLQHGENTYDSTGNLVYNAGADVEVTVRNDSESRASYNILGGRRVNALTIEGTVRYELWRGIELSVHLLHRSVNYPEGTPLNPQITPYGIITTGIKAIL